MAQPEHMTMNRTKKFQAGFSLLETMVAMAVLLGVGAIVMYGTLRMMNTQGTITNRTEMHSSVRSATELLQQEIGQAGRIAPPLDLAGKEAGNLKALAPTGSINPNPTSLGRCITS